MEESSIEGVQSELKRIKQFAFQKKKLLQVIDFGYLRSSWFKQQLPPETTLGDHLSGYGSNE